MKIAIALVVGLVIGLVLGIGLGAEQGKKELLEQQALAKPKVKYPTLREENAPKPHLKPGRYYTPRYASGARACESLVDHWPSAFFSLESRLAAPIERNCRTFKVGDKLLSLPESTIVTHDLGAVDRYQVFRHEGAEWMISPSQVRPVDEAKE